MTAPTVPAPAPEPVPAPAPAPAPEPAPTPRPSTKELLRRAKLPTQTVPICLSTDLQEQYDELERQLNEAYVREKIDSRLAGGASVGIARQMLALREQMAEFVVVFEITSLGKRWNNLIKEHPPRDGEAEDTYLGFNPDTFFDAAIKACCIAPTDLDDEDWDALLGDDEQPGKLTAGQYKLLEEAVLRLNVRKLDLPNSLAASRILASANE